VDGIDSSSAPPDDYIVPCYIVCRHLCRQRFPAEEEESVPARLADLVTAIAEEPDPAVRGRAAVAVLQDLTDASARAWQTLESAVRDLEQSGFPPEHIAALLDHSPPRPDRG
jgi:hypothetical protein